MTSVLNIITESIWHELTLIADHLLISQNMTCDQLWVNCEFVFADCELCWLDTLCCVMPTVSHVIIVYILLSNWLHNPQFHISSLMFFCLTGFTIHSFTYHHRWCSSVWLASQFTVLWQIEYNAWDWSGINTEYMFAIGSTGIGNVG